MGIAKVSFRDKEHLAALRFKDEAFVLETMYWPDEIRDGRLRRRRRRREGPGAGARDGQAADRVLSGEWNPEEFTDEYREALLQIVEAKLAGEQIEVAAPEPTAKVVDLMEALKASVAAAKKEARREPAAREAGREEGAAAKKTTAKKPAAGGRPREAATATRKKAVGE